MMVGAAKPLEEFFAWAVALTFGRSCSLVKQISVHLRDIRH